MIRARALQIAGASDMSNRIAVAILAAGFVLAGCSGSGSDGIGPTDPTSGNGDPGSSSGVGEFHPSFAPLSGVLPFPTDLYFAGSTDGTLNSPVTPFLPNAATLNALDGFSTVASSTVRFSAPINAATISPATVIVLEVDVDNATKATVGFRRALIYGTDYSARVAPTTDSGGATLEIVPLKPLTPSTGATNVGYLVILTNGLQDTTGNVATPDRDYVSIKDAQPTCAALTGTLNSICLLTGAHLAIASAVGVPAANVVLTYSFSTQSTADTLAAATATVPDASIGVVFTGQNLQALNPALPPIADVYVGQLAISYYLDPAAPLTGMWEAAPGGPGVPSTNLTRFNPVPVAKAENFPIPLFVTVPNAGSGQVKPVAGWPVVIFQHGLTGNRTQAAAIAGTYASQGFVVAAIDIPLHGITDPMNGLYQGVAERTFNLDLDGTPGFDPSGTHFINLESLLTSRDNLRQGALDIVQLAGALPNLDLDGDTVSDIDGARIHFSGLSLGGMVGTVANAMPIPTISAYLNAPGGAVANLIRDSDSLGPVVQAGLEAAGLVADTTLYEQFFRDAQTAIDAGDPINFIAGAVAARPVLLSQVDNDAVVPNTATQRLVNATTFVKTATPGLNPVAAGTGTWVQFTSGEHGSLLRPTFPEVTTEMHTHAASLVASGGAAFAITNPAILAP
jgi:Bacterial virulence factor lipase N-terminal/Platelet-activating factor acetylhydrolase, isoform II